MTSSFFQRLTRQRTEQPYLIAVGFMLLSCFGFSLMNVGVRLLAEDGMHPGLIVALRNGLTLSLLLPFALRARASLIRTQRLAQHAGRATIGAIGMITWTYCLTLMPLAHATALSFTAPLFATLFAVVFLGESAGRTRWIALLIGFGGTLVILHPSPQDFNWHSLLVMFATAAWAIAGLMVKSLTRTEPPMRIVFYMNFFMFLWALPLGLFHWQWPTTEGWGILLLIAFCSILMHFSMAKAYAMAPVVSLMPFDFTRLIYTAILAWLVFQEGSAFTTWIGGAIILGSAMLSTRASRRDAKAALASPE